MADATNAECACVSDQNCTEKPIMCTPYVFIDVEIVPFLHDIILVEHKHSLFHIKYFLELGVCHMTKLTKGQHVYAFSENVVFMPFGITIFMCYVKVFNSVNTL